MKTEIRFLLDLVLEHKLPLEAKKLCLERIGEVETSLQRGPLISPMIPPVYSVGAPAKSAAQLKYESEVAAGTIPVVAPVPSTPPPPALPVAARIVGGEVNTGNGSRGPRKF